MANTVSAPYGLRYARTSPNLQSSGGTSNLYRIKQNYSGVIPFGAPVRLSTTNDPSSSFGNGYIVNISSGTMNQTGTLDLYVGVFVGCSYTNPLNNQPQWSQWYPGSVNATDIQAYVIDDPGAVYMIQADSTSFDALAQTGYSYNLNVPGTPYNSGTGDSTISLDTASGTGTAYPFKVVGLALTPNNTNASGYVDCLVKINGGFQIFSRTN